LRRHSCGQLSIDEGSTGGSKCLWGTARYEKKEPFCEKSSEAVKQAVGLNMRKEVMDISAMGKRKEQ
jgi:hypothetical protein